MASRRRISDGPLVVAYGLGVDSTAILVELARRRVHVDAILFADVGNEKPETYALLPTMQRFLKAHDMPPVTTVRYVLEKPTKRDERGNLIWYKTLEEECLRHKHWPGLAYGSKDCSLKWKRQPQHKWLSNFAPAVRAWDAGGKVTTIIGYDTSPKDMRRQMHLDDERYEYSFPLRDWQWDRERCKAEIKAARLPKVLKSSCFYCPASKPWEITWLVRKHPDLADRIYRLEEIGWEYSRKRMMQGKSYSTGLWRHGTKGTRGGICKPNTMSEWIDIVRAADASGHGKDFVGYSEELDGFSRCEIEHEDMIDGGCVGF